mmetsp:Transcript_47250/g.101152  ORF Transcript_47250/g.101152 Transcript_47250/m.101152 type:complete len:143 (-) Transcript_47250:792-1220(-)
MFKSTSLAVTPIAAGAGKVAAAAGGEVGEAGIFASPAPLLLFCTAALEFEVVGFFALALLGASAVAAEVAEMAEATREGASLLSAEVLWPAPLNGPELGASEGTSDDAMDIVLFRMKPAAANRDIMSRQRLFGSNLTGMSMA